MNNKRPPVFCIMGPTASGKTKLAVELVQQGPFEIISVDSAQVYRGLDIGSGKPGAEILQLAPHRLIDIRDPADAYSAADFRHDALVEIAAIQAKGKIPLLVGGTMLYFKALRDGLAAMPAANETVRKKIIQLATEQGWQAVHDKLAEVDPASAARIHPNDPQRLQRALEVYELTGIPMTAHHKQATDPDKLAFQLHFIAIYPQQRSVLHENIAARFRQMLADGFVDEVKVLYERGDLDPSLPAIRSVGYRQIWDYLARHHDYDSMQEKALAATRQLAKRQLTWLRSWPELQLLDSEMSQLCEKSLKLINSTLK